MDDDDADLTPQSACGLDRHPWRPPPRLALPVPPFNRPRPTTTTTALETQ